MKVTQVKVVVVEVPQIDPIAPYRSHVRTSSTTRSALVEVQTDAGLTGWGEFNVNFIPFEAEPANRQATEWLVGRDPRHIERFHAECPFEPRLRSGVEMALWDVAAQACEVPLAHLLGGIVRDRIELAACMGIQSYERAGEIASQYVEAGYGTLKTKAGSEMREDIEMVRGVRDAVGDRLQLRIDPNCAYSKEESLELARQLEEYQLQYLEQPLPMAPLEDAVWLRERSPVPIALNESVTDPASVFEILRVGAAGIVLPDTHIAGGIWPSVKIGHLAQAAGATCVMHCGHDLGPKTAAMLHVAAACPAYSLANDSTYYGLEEDICVEPLKIERGTMAVPTTPGLGVAGDWEKIRKRMG